MWRSHEDQESLSADSDGQQRVRERKESQYAERNRSDMPQSPTLAKFDNC